VNDLLILGLGNRLLTDDGLGSVAIDRLLERWQPPEGVLAIDGGTLGLDLLSLVTSAERLIIVDAVLDDRPPGTLVRYEGEEIGTVARERLSPHQIGVSDLLEAAEWLGDLPKKRVLIGLVPASLSLGVILSPEVEVRFTELLQAVASEVGAMGFGEAP
jgi:hydrogenase maturation protease